MATHPKYQRKGIGRLLVQWGIDVAESLGLPVYLESTQGGLPLYEAVGFEKLTHETLVHRASDTGDSEDIEMSLMVKLPTKAKGIAFKEWANKGYPESY